MITRAPGPCRVLPCSPYPFLGCGGGRLAATCSAQASCLILMYAGPPACRSQPLLAGVAAAAHAAPPPATRAYSQFCSPHMPARARPPTGTRAHPASPALHPLFHFTQHPTPISAPLTPPPPTHSYPSLSNHRIHCIRLAAGPLRIPPALAPATRRASERSFPPSCVAPLPPSPCLAAPPQGAPALPSLLPTPTKLSARPPPFGPPSSHPSSLELNRTAFFLARHLRAPAPPTYDPSKRRAPAPSRHESPPSPQEHPYQ